MTIKIEIKDKKIASIALYKTNEDGEEVLESYGDFLRRNK